MTVAATMAAVEVPVVASVEGCVASTVVGPATVAVTMAAVEVPVVASVEGCVALQTACNSF